MSVKVVFSECSVLVFVVSRFEVFLLWFSDNFVATAVLSFGDTVFPFVCHILSPLISLTSF